MDSNVHIDPATFQFPAPPEQSIEEEPSQLAHLKSHVPKGSTRLQPRSAGFIPRPSGKDREPWRLNRQICDELVRGPPSAIQDEGAPPEHRKRSLKKLFGSRLEHKTKKMPVATQRTSDGRRYGQILSEQVYDGSGNASTYQVNNSRRPLRPPASEGQRKDPTASFHLFGHVDPTIHQVQGAKEPVPGRSAHRSLEIGEVNRRLSPYQTAGFPDPVFESLENRLLMDGPMKRKTAAGQNDPNRPKSLTDAATLQSSPRKSANDDSLGLLRDFSHILSRGETTTPTAATSRIPVPEAEHQPRVRDFAAGGSAPFSRARAAVRRRSGSPFKGAGKQRAAKVPPDRSLNAVTYEVQAANPPDRSPNRIILPPVAFKEPARSPLAPLLPMTNEQVPGTKVSPVINHHSKAPSVVSAESTAEDIQSDASSGVVSNAQSAVFVKVPPQPGPAPLTPLPSLPEGLASATPRTSQSSQRLASPGNSPPKVPPPKSPARSQYQYKLYPSGSPIRRNAAADLGQVMAQPSPPLRSKRRGISFPRADLLPTSMSVGALEELEQWKKERAENTKQKKLRDLARVMSYKAAIEEVEPVTRNTVDGRGYHQGVAGCPRDSYNSALFALQHRPQSSDESIRIATTAYQYRDSSTLSQKLSPIVIVAEQEPIPAVWRAPSQKSDLIANSIDGHPRGFKTNGFYPVPPQPASPTLQRPEVESKVRPVSSHSLPVPRPVASRVLTPHLSPLLRRPSHSSSHRSSIHEVNGLEARLSAMERKNAMLERAFLAVINTSAAFGGSLGLNGMDGADGSSGLSGRDGDRSSGTSGTESLYAGLEKSGRAGARWSASIGP